MEQILFGSRTINTSMSTATMAAYINGTMPIPDTYYIGTNCKRNHGAANKGVRYVNGKECVICHSIKTKKQRNKPTESGKTHKSAMDAYEDQKMLKDLSLDLDSILDDDLL